MGSNWLFGGMTSGDAMQAGTQIFQKLAQEQQQKQAFAFEKQKFDLLKSIQTQQMKNEQAQINMQKQLFPILMEQKKAQLEKTGAETESIKKQTGLETDKFNFALDQAAIANRIKFKELGISQQEVDQKKLQWEQQYSLGMAELISKYDPNRQLKEQFVKLLGDVIPYSTSIGQATKDTMDILMGNLPEGQRATAFNTLKDFLSELKSLGKMPTQTFNPPKGESSGFPLFHNKTIPEDVSEKMPTHFPPGVTSDDYKAVQEWVSRNGKTSEAKKIFQDYYKDKLSPSALGWLIKRLF